MRTLSKGGVMRYKIVRLDCGGAVEERALSREDQEQYIGGLGVAAKLMSEMLSEASVPLGADVPLIVTAGPLNATGFPGANRAVFYSQSPATGLASVSCMGGSFGNKLAQTGTLTYVFVGKVPEPSIVVIDEDEISLKPRPDLWGRPVTDARTALEKEYRGGEVALIGPAGENLTVIANVRGDEGHTAGRAGLGAVMGSKNLKAIIVRGKRKPEVFDETGFKAYLRDAHKAVRDNTYLRDVQGPQGTVNLVQMMNEANGLPTANFRRSSFDQAPQLYAGRVVSEFVVRSTTCPGCPVRCRKHVSLDGKTYESPEYESIWALGPENEIADFALITKANHLCNEYGMDTMSTGCLLGMYQERVGKFTTPEDLLEGIRNIATHSGYGELLAQGIRQVEKTWGVDYGMHSKGLELAAYDPRRLPGMALAYATAQRGGCHCRAWTVGDELFGPKLDVEGLASLVIRYQNAACVRDSLIMCVFVDGTFGLPGYATALRHATGIGYTIESLGEIGERIFNLERLINLRQGLTAADDTLPPRLLQAEHGELFAASKEAYYRLRGWNGSGAPTADKRASLGL
jgi:aldehyde:ferredoxin oxidoreductase